MIFGQKSEMEKFHDICENIMPRRVSLITNYGDWEDRVVMKGPHLKVSVRNNQDEEDMRIRITDERGMTVEVPCEGIEIVEVQKTKWDFEAHIYFFTFGGFARINIIGQHLHQLTEGLRLESNCLINSKG